MKINFSYQSYKFNKPNKQQLSFGTEKSFTNKYNEANRDIFTTDDAYYTGKTYAIGKNSEFITFESPLQAALYFRVRENVIQENLGKETPEYLDSCDCTFVRADKVERLNEMVEYAPITCSFSPVVDYNKITEIANNI